MNLRIRRIIMFSFIAVFLTFAPILIFYASGYRIDFKRGKILKTGTLLIEAKNIKGANLYLNNKLLDEPFNEKKFIYNLIPGEYQIKLEKEGYHDWQKKVTIISSLTTFAKDTVLFKNTPPLQLIEQAVENFHFSPDMQRAIYLTQTEEFTEIYHYELGNKENKLIYRIPTGKNDIDISWAASSKKVLINVNSDCLIFDINNLSKSLALKDLFDFRPDNVKWDINSDNLLYIIENNSLYRFDILAQKLQLLLTAENDINREFFIESNDIFYIQPEENNNALLKYNLNFQTNKKILELSKSDDYKFIESTNNFLGLVDLEQQKLFLIKKVITDFEINIGAEPIKEFSAKAAFWDDKENQLLIYNDFEIYTYNTRLSAGTFINRYGQEIKKAVWYPNLFCIAILFDNRIEIIDVNVENGSRNVTQIVKFDQLNNFYLDRKGVNLYFNGQIGKQQGIYQLELR